MKAPAKGRPYNYTYDTTNNPNSGCLKWPLKCLGVNNPLQFFRAAGKHFLHANTITIEITKSKPIQFMFLKKHANNKTFWCAPRWKLSAQIRENRMCPNSRNWKSGKFTNFAKFVLQLCKVPLSYRPRLNNQAGLAIKCLRYERLCLKKSLDQAKS
jgi:hypothetical protein